MKFLKFIFYLVLICFYNNAFAVTNIFNNNSGDKLWSNAANWSLGHVPLATEDVTISGAVVELLIPNGTIAICTNITISAEVRVQAGGELQVSKQIDIVGVGSSLTNNGKIILPTNNFGIKVTIGGELINNQGDSIIIQGTITATTFNNPILVTGGIVINRGFINIIESDEVNAIRCDNVSGYIGKIDNRASGIIDINQSKGYGIFANDSLINAGQILISNILVANANVPTAAIITESWGRIINSGEINCSLVGDRGINNDDGIITNTSTGSINIHDFSDEGIMNNSIFYQDGDIFIESTNSQLNNKGIHLNAGSFFFRAYSTTEINGNHAVSYGIYGNRNMTNDSLSSIYFKKIKKSGFFSNFANFTNRGLVDIDSCTTQYAIGVELTSSGFYNYGIIFAKNSYAGVRTSTQFSANNYGWMFFKNMSSYGINTNFKFNNHAGATIACYRDDGLQLGSGIFHADGGTTYSFTNDGFITIDSFYIGIDFRSSQFINNGTINILHPNWGIEFGAFQMLPYLPTMETLP